MSADVTVAAIAAAPGVITAAAVWAQLKRQDRGQRHIIARINETDISSEMVTNHGSSVKDQLNRMEHSQRETRDDIGGIRSENRQLWEALSLNSREHIAIRQELVRAIDHYHPEGQSS